MDFDALMHIRDLVWLYAALPVLVVAGLVLTVRLKAVQWRRLNDAANAVIKRVEPSETKWLSPGLAMVISAVGAYGAAGAVGGATAVSLGGAGVLPYVWLFGIVLAPLRYAEVWLARTDAPGGGDAEASGTLARRLMRMGSRFRLLGWLLALSVAATAFMFAGATQGEGVLDAAERLMPGNGQALVGAIAGAAAILVLGGKRTAAITGWLGVVGLAFFVISALWAIGTHPGASLATLGQAFSAAFEGAPQSGDFTGAFAGEVAFAAALYALPTPAAFTGVAGGVHSLAAGTTKRQVAAALLGPFIYAVVTTMMVMAIVGTGAHGERLAGERRAMPEIITYRVGAETVSQRTEEARRFDGYIRIHEGKPRNPTLSFGTERGMIREPAFDYQGASADVAVHIEAGKAFRLLPASSGGSLQEISPSHLWDVEVVGELLPRGSGLAISAANKGGGEIASRVMVAALLALMLVALVAWGYGVARSFPPSFPVPAQAFIRLLPAAGLALLLSGAIPGLPILGTLLAGISTTLAGLLLLLRTAESATLDG